ncbi:MAG: hypothetical protein Q8M92_00865, partial [Candidatus Subteraquimicrobiales bacterium]|nr:hypothetical protein [Candidatus Subteraquimicrobiales bacterium]
MAGTVTANMATISMCELVGDFAAVGGTLAQNVDVNLEGTACIQNYSAAAAARGADRTISSTNLTHQNIYCWFSTTKATAIPALGANGMRIRLASATNDWSEWDIFGGGTLPHGGWLSWTIRTSVTPSRIGTNPATLSAIITVGWRCGTAGTTVPAKVAIYFDAWRYGTGLNLYAGTSGDPAKIEDLITAENTSYYGVINKTFGVYYLQGQLNVGSTTADTATYFQDSSKVIVFKDVSVGSGFYNI